MPFGYNHLVVHGRGSSYIVILDKIVAIPSRNEVEGSFIWV